MKKGILKLTKLPSFSKGYRRLSSSNGSQGDDEHGNKMKNIIEFAPVVGTDHSYIKMNWMLNFQKENKDAQENSPNVSETYETKLSKFNVEKDESDDIEDIKLVQTS